MFNLSVWNLIDNSKISIPPLSFIFIIIFLFVPHLTCLCARHGGHMSKSIGLWKGGWAFE